MQTTATPTTTSASAGCSNKNITYYVQNHDDIVTVWITPDTFTQLPVGSFMYNVSGFALSVNIIRVGELTFYAEYVIVCTWCVCVCYIYIWDIWYIDIYTCYIYVQCHNICIAHILPLSLTVHQIHLQLQRGSGVALDTVFIAPFSRHLGRMIG